MYSTDTLVRILEECREGESPAFVLVEVDGVLHVTPRSRPEAYPVTISRDPFGYTLYFTCATRCPTADLASSAIHRILFGSQNANINANDDRKEHA